MWLLNVLIVPVTLPVKLPSKVPATNVSEPTVHLSSLSSQTKVLLGWVPLSISIPPSSVGVAPVKLLLRTIWLSAKLIVSVLTIVWVPLTVKSPSTTKLPSICALPATSIALNKPPDT